MATEDILINDGDSFVSLSALAAEQVDAKLPIESDDGTVKLDSPSANTFSIETGGEERVKVEPDGRIGFGKTSTSILSYFANEVSGGGTSLYGVYCDSKASSNKTSYTVFTSSPFTTGGGKAVNSLIHYQTYYKTGGGSQAADIVEQVGFNVDGGQFTAANKNVVLKSTLNKVDGKENFVIRSTGDAPSYFAGVVQAGSFAGLSANDVQFSLTNGFEIYTEDLKIAKFDKSGRFVVGETISNAIWNRFSQVATPGGNDLWALYVDVKAPSTARNIRVFTSDPQLDDAAAVSNLTHFTPYYGTGGGTFAATVGEQNALSVDNATFQAGEKNYVIKSTLNSAADKDNFFIYSVGSAPSKFGGQIQTNKITSKDAAANDASIELGAELLTTNHTPTQPNSIATKQTVDDKIWVGSTADYMALTKKPTTLYCLTD